MAALLAAVFMSGTAQAKPAAPKFYAYVIGSGLSPRAISDAGQVVGHDYALQLGFITGPKGKGVTYLGTFAGGYSVPEDINAVGQVVGQSDGKAFIADADGRNMREIVMPVASYQNATATSINDRGEVAGTYYVEIGGAVDWHGFVTDPGGLNARTVAGLNPGRTALYAINNLGQVAGHSQSADGSSQLAFVTGPGGVGATEVDKGDTWGLTIYALNDAGQLGGRATLPGGKYAGHGSNPFVAEPGQPIEIKKNLGGGNGTVLGMNELGDYVGWAQEDYGKPPYHGFVSVRRGKPTRLDVLVVNVPGIEMGQVPDINNKRQTAATATDGNAYIICPAPNCE